MNLPKLPKIGKGDNDSKAASDDKVSKFLSELYRDLSDRHLLLPVIGLLVAIVAVPMLLSSGTEPVVPPAAPVTAGDDPSALDAAVLVTDPGIRNYRERLEELKEKNPFEGDTAASGPGGNEGTATTTVAGSGDSSGSSDSPASTPSTGSTSSSTSTGSTSSGSVSVDTGTDTSTGTTAPPADTPDTTDPGASDDGETKPNTRFYASRVDVAVGPVGKTKTVENVKALDFLPDRRTPVVAYLGLVDETHALFSVNPGVAETQGEGDCAPQRNGCMYLTLEIGQEQRFVYGDAEDAEIYRLKLLDTHIVRVPDPLKDGHEEGDGGKVANRAPTDTTSLSD